MVWRIELGAGGRGVLDLAVRRCRRRLQHGQGIAVAALAHQRDGLDLLRRRRIGGEHAGGARLAHRALDARILLAGQRLLEGGQRGGVASLEEGFGGAPAHGGVGAHQGERADGRLDDAAQPVVDPHAVEVGFGSAAGRLAGDRLGQGELVAVGPADEDKIVGLANVELARGQRLQNGGGAGIARYCQRAYRGLAIAETAGGEVAHERRKVGGPGRHGDQRRGQRRQQHCGQTQEEHG